MRGFLAAATAAGVTMVTADPPIMVYYFPQWSHWTRKLCGSEMFKEGQFRGMTHIQYAFHAPDKNCEIHSDDWFSDMGQEGWIMPCETPEFCDLGLSYDQYDQTKPWPSKDRGHIGCINKFRKNTNVQFGVSLGGWTLSNDFSYCVQDDAMRAKFVDNIVKAQKELGWDFIDFDWEYPKGGGNDGWNGKSDDWDKFELLIKEIKAKSDVKLAAAVGMSPLLLTGTGTYDIPTPAKFMCEELDYVSLMTYDYWGGWDASSTGWPSSAEFDPEAKYENADRLSVRWGLEWWKEQCGDKFNKVVLGLPAYGKAWKNVAAGPEGNGLYQAAGPLELDEGSYEGDADYPHVLGEGTFDRLGTLDIWDLETNYVRNHPTCKHYWHDVAKQDWLYCPGQSYDGNAKKDQFIAFDGPEAMFYKAQMASQMGAGGLMFWDAGYMVIPVKAEKMPGSKLAATKANTASVPEGPYVWSKYEDAFFDGWNGGSIEPHRSGGERYGNGGDLPDMPTKEPDNGAAPNCNEVVKASVSGGGISESCVVEFCTAICEQAMQTACSSIENPKTCVDGEVLSVPPAGKAGYSCEFADK